MNFSDSENLNNIDKIDEKFELIRSCGYCNKEFHFQEVKEKYPVLYHEILKKTWQKPEIKFYCSYCYLLKLIRHVKKEKSGKKE